MKLIFAIVSIGVIGVSYLIYQSSAVRFVLSFATPISYYGLVLDQNGNPVSEAKVEYTLNNKPFGDGSHHITSSDSQGYFEIKGSGISIYVEVSKTGHYRMPPREDRAGSYGGLIPDLPGKIPPVGRDHPAIYVLYKQGAIEPLLKQKKMRSSINKDGTPRSLALGKDDGRHSITVQCWTDDTDPNSEGEYDWRFKVSVPNGGLLVSEDAFAFEAPTIGYQHSDEYTMLKNSKEQRWQDSVAKSYFVRFHDDIYARIDLRMISYGDHFVVFSGHLNPKPGSRNLEVNPAEK